jgi:prepilin-type N-terminal cleavage/methylation domain-containing protein
MTSRQRQTQQGMTLLEVMIALGILAVLGVLTARTIRDYDESRRKYRSQIIQESELRDAINIMRADIASAFHFRDLTWEIDTEALRATPSASPSPAAASAGAPGQPPAAASPTPGADSPPAAPTPLLGAPTAPPPVEPLPSPIPLTGLLGSTDSLFFTVNNHQRRQADSPESDLARIGYLLRSCRPRDPKRSSESIKCLVRSTLPSLGPKIDEPGEETVLLRHVTDFRLRYLPERPLGENIDDAFVESWKSDGSGFASGGGSDGNSGSGSGAAPGPSTQFPAAVEIYIKTEDPGNPLFRSQVMTVLAPVRFPNNPRPRSSPQSGDRS